MSRQLLRTLVILIAFSLQLLWIGAPLVILVLALLVNVYVSPRESYILIVGTGLLLDLFGWRIAGLSTTVVLLILLKACEMILARRHADSSWHGQLASVAICAGLYALTYFFSVPFLPWLVRSLSITIVAVGVFFIFLIPVQRVGGWYKKAQATGSK